MLGKAERVIAHEVRGALGVARFQRLDDVHVIADRPLDAVFLANGLSSDHPHVGEQVLGQLDQHWRDHLAAMDYLRQGIHLRGYAQKDYRYEYKREAFELFTAMLGRVKYDVASMMSKIEFRTQEQIDHFNQEGWLFLPELFNPEETSFLAREAEGIYAANRPEVWREKSGAPRTAFAAHLYNEAFGVLGAHPRMIDPIEQIFGEPVYMHQFKINAKSAFTGDVWQWHQDYGTWKRDDGMPEPRAMNIAIFLDEVMPINGPLMLVPKSQTAGDLKASHDLETTSYPLWTLDEETVTRLVKQGGIVAPTGKAGGMLMFHGNLVHGSSGNITPYPRKIVYLTLNAVSNYIRTPTRPEYIAHRDFTPIQPVDDDALIRLARAPRQAAE